MCAQIAIRPELRLRQPMPRAQRLRLKYCCAYRHPAAQRAIPGTPQKKRDGGMEPKALELSLQGSVQSAWGTTRLTDYG